MFYVPGMKILVSFEIEMSQEAAQGSIISYFYKWISALFVIEKYFYVADYSILITSESTSDSLEAKVSQVVQLFEEWFWKNLRRFAS